MVVFFGLVVRGGGEIGHCFSRVGCDCLAGFAKLRERLMCCAGEEGRPGRFSGKGMVAFSIKWGWIGRSSPRPRESPISMPDECPRDEVHCVALPVHRVTQNHWDINNGRCSHKSVKPYTDSTHIRIWLTIGATLMVPSLRFIIIVANESKDASETNRICRGKLHVHYSCTPITTQVLVVSS